jgi:hypothetical protein
MAGTAKRFCQFYHKLFVCITLSIPQAEIAMGYGKIKVTGSAKMYENRTVYPPAARQQQTLAKQFGK